jgi:hypothetical protein
VALFLIVKIARAIACAELVSSVLHVWLAVFDSIAVLAQRLSVCVVL